VSRVKGANNGTPVKTATPAKAAKAATNAKPAKPARPSAAAAAAAAAPTSTGIPAGVEKQLEDLARAARDRAYAPYSNFRVGAALVAADGRIYTGANVENASYGLTICAERNAVMAMALAGSTDVRAIFVASDIAPPASPCGMCRQTLLEFVRDPTATRVVVISPKGHHDGWTLAELIPHGFTGDELDRPRPEATSSRRRPRPRRPKAL
jgi:cytidine deaminase